MVTGTHSQGPYESLLSSCHTCRSGQTCTDRPYRGREIRIGDPGPGQTPGKQVVMVNVEADVLCGAVLTDRARAQGVVYSMAYGDQPAAICELVD